MSLRQHQLDHATCTALAAEMLGGPVRALVLDWELESVMRRRLRLEQRRGVGCDEAILRFLSSRHGHELARLPNATASMHRVGPFMWCMSLLRASGILRMNRTTFGQWR